MTRSKRLKAPTPDRPVEDVQEWLATEMRRQALREANHRSTGLQRQREEGQAERAELFVAAVEVRAPAFLEAFTRGGAEEANRLPGVHLECMDDDPIIKAIVAGEITDPAQARELRFRAAGWASHDSPA